MLYSKTLTDILEPVKTDLDIVIERIKKNLSSDNELIDDIIAYVFSTGGKHIRPALGILCSRLYTDKLENDHYTVAQIAEIIHTASLIHDDVIDNSNIRRNKETVNSHWGNKEAVISGDYLLARASKIISNLNQINIVVLYANVLEELCKGEIMQNALLYNPEISWELYILKSKRKTALLFESVMEGAAIISDSDEQQKEAVKAYGLNLGLAFQVYDDVLNFRTTDEMGKPSCDDLKNGIITAPVLYAIEETPELKSLISTLNDNTDAFKKANRIIQESSGIIKAKKLARQYSEKAINSLNSFKQSSTKDSLIQLAEYVTQRRF